MCARSPDSYKHSPRERRDRLEHPVALVREAHEALLHKRQQDVELRLQPGERFAHQPTMVGQHRSILLRPELAQQPLEPSTSEKNSVTVPDG
jgi:hypothetical protein